jgi:hypothetical protein
MRSWKGSTNLTANPETKPQSIGSKEKKIMRKLMVLLAIAGLMLMAVPAAQAYVYVDLTTDATGFRSSTDGNTIAQGFWTGTDGFKISWNIVKGDEYEYNYLITNLTGGPVDPRVQALAFAVSPDFQLIELPETTPAGALVGPIVLGGVSFDNAIYWTSLNAQTVAVHFDSLSAPVWGSFSAIDSAFGDPDPSIHNGDALVSIFMPDGATNFADYIPVPNAVPVPPSVWLFGSGLIGLVGLGWRRRKTT